MMTKESLEYLLHKASNLDIILRVWMIYELHSPL